eukprot:Skav209914  [mRNA]  locus=scaffold1253:110625:111914:- [translate_table: standard]
MEAHCLRRLQSSGSSQWVVRLFYEIISPAEWVGILELCSCELWEKIKHCGCLSQGELAWYAPQMVEALAAVHSLGIVHRDIKCENYLVTADHALKLIDFGTARDTQHPEVPTMMLGPQYEHHVGTPNFMSPEAIDGKVNDRKSDLWSLGCALYQLLLGVAPFNAATPFLILTKAQAGSIWLPSTGVEGLEGGVDLVNQLLRKDPEDRLGSGNTRDILNHGPLSMKPDHFPMDTPLLEVLRQLSRAMVAEVDAKVAADEAAAEAAQWEDAPGAIAPVVAASPGPKPGDATQKLLNQLKEHECNTEFIESSECAKLKEAIQRAVERDSASWMLGIADALEETDSFAAKTLRRFQELSQQRLKESQETFDFGGSEDSSASDGEHASNGSKPDAPGDRDAAQAGASKEAQGQPGLTQPQETSKGKATLCCDLM